MAPRISDTITLLLQYYYNTIMLFEDQRSNPASRPMLIMRARMNRKV